MLQEILVPFLFPLSAGVALLVFGLERWRPVLGFKRVCASDVSGPGPAHIQGVAMPREPLVDPIYGKPCAYFHVVVWEPGNLHRIFWKEQSSGHFFDVQDRTGKVAVLADRATWGSMYQLLARRGNVLTDKVSSYVGRGNDSSALHYLGTAAVRGVGALPENVCVSAVIIRPEQRLCVAGWANQTTGGLALSKARFQPLLISDYQDSLETRRVAGAICTLAGAALVGLGIMWLTASIG